MVWEQFMRVQSRDTNRVKIRTDGKTVTHRPTILVRWIFPLQHYLWPYIWCTTLKYTSRVLGGMFCIDKDYSLPSIYLRADLAIIRVLLTSIPEFPLNRWRESQRNRWDVASCSSWSEWRARAATSFTCLIISNRVLPKTPLLFREVAC